LDRTKTRAVLKDRGAARARSGHPWVYRSDVAEAGGEVGDVVPVFGRKGNLLGHAFYNPGSEITLRIATRRDEPVDETWFRARIEEALSSRDSFEIDGDAYRLLHAEADGIPGLVVDRYGDYLVLQVGSAAVEKRLDWIVGALADLVSPRGLLLRGDSAARREEGLGSMVLVLYGEVPEFVVVREGSVRYRADLWSGQKTVASWTSGKTTSPQDATPGAGSSTPSPTPVGSPCTRRGAPKPSKPWTRADPPSKRRAPTLN
jgi:23S rRNA (cytosine1962-C5)-methyltransferase